MQQLDIDFRLIIETAEEGVWVVNGAGQTEFANIRFCQLLGYDVPEEIFGQYFLDLVAKESKPVALKAFEQRTYGQSGSYDMQLRAKNGEDIWAHMAATPLFSEDGQYMGSFSLVTDIREHKRMEEELRRSRDKFEEMVLERTSFLTSILENIPDMIFVKDAVELRYVQVNRALEAFMGLSRAELIGKNDFDLVPEDEAEFFISKDRQVLASNKVLDIPEEPIHTRSKGVRTLHTKKIPIHDPEGNPRYLLGISEDITLHKQIAAEKRARVDAEGARERADFLAEVSRTLAGSLEPEKAISALAHSLVPELGDWCLITVEGPEGRISAAAHADPSKESLVAGLAGFAPDLEASEGIPRVLRTKKGLVYSDIDELLLEQSGASVFGTRRGSDIALFRELGARSFLAVPVIAREKMMGVLMLASIRDTRRYGALELEMAKEIASRAALAIDNAILYKETREAVRIREDFISIASHELRTPLTPLAAQIQLLERMISRGDPAVMARGDLMRVLRMSKNDIVRLSRLVENLLDISKIGAGKLVLKRARVNLSDLIREVAVSLKPELQSAGSELDLRVQEPIFALIDWFRIEQVVTNLMTNAIKFGAGKPISLSLKRGTGVAVIEVRDRGMGISRQDLKRIFERFERAVSERQFGGLGLGLYIAKEIVLAHGGTIHAVSEPEAGSTFTVEIPLTGA